MREEINFKPRQVFRRNASFALITLLAALQLSCESTSGPAVSIVAAEAAAASAGSSGTVYTATASCAGTGSETAVYIFITSSAYDGGLGGRAGADAKCVADKNSNYPTLACTKVRALLSFGPMDSIGNAQTTCNFSPTAPVKRPDGTNVVAGGYLTFPTGPLDNPITTTTLTHWTMSDMAGNQDPADNCQTGGSSNGADSGVIGASDSTMNYITNGSQACNQTHRLMCLCF